MTTKRRQFARYAALCIGAAGLLAIAPTACTEDKPAAKDPLAQDVGSITLALTLPDGSTINTVNYSITGGSLIAPVLGAIPVSMPGATISAQVVLPAGLGYAVELSAVTSRQASCKANAMFAIAPRQITHLTMVLACNELDNDGVLVINGRVDNCPKITGQSAQPIETGVGNQITLLSSASDGDGDALTFAWTATAGAFADAAAANTTWTCPSAGPHVLTLTVSDGAVACNKSVVIPVLCTNPPQPVLARTFRVASHGLTAAQTASLQAAFSLPNLALDEHGVARFTDEQAFLALPMQTLPPSPISEDHQGPVASEGFDFDAIGRIQVMDIKAAAARVEGALREVQLLPANGRPDASHTLFEAVRADGTQIVNQPIDTAVTYQFALDGLPLEGPGAKLRVAFDGAGKVTQLSMAVRGLEPLGEIPVVDKGEAMKRCASWSSRAGTDPGLRVVDAQLAYFAPPLTSRIDTLTPSVRCLTMGTAGGVGQVFFVPAAIDAQPDPFQDTTPPRPMPLTGGGLSTTGPLSVTRTDVGSEGTGPCSGLPHTALNVASFNNRMTAAGIPVQFSWLDGNAWEDDWKDPSKSGHDSDWVDDVDMAYWQGHGSPGGFWFSGCSAIDDNHLNFADALWGNRDAEWISLFTCLVLNTGSPGSLWYQRWGGAFDRLHQINSFDTVSYHSAVHGGIFAEYMMRNPFLWWNNPMTVRQAWAQTSIDDQPGSVVWATMGVISAGGWVNWNDYFWGKGPVGPDVAKAQVAGWWRVWGGS